MEQSEGIEKQVLLSDFRVKRVLFYSGEFSSCAWTPVDSLVRTHTQQAADPHTASCESVRRKL